MDSSAACAGTAGRLTPMSITARSRAANAWRLLAGRRVVVILGGSFGSRGVGRTTDGLVELVVVNRFGEYGTWSDRVFTTGLANRFDRIVDLLTETCQWSEAGSPAVSRTASRAGSSAGRTSRGPASRPAGPPG